MIFSLELIKSYYNELPAINSGQEKTWKASPFQEKVLYSHLVRQKKFQTL